MAICKTTFKVYVKQNEQFGVGYCENQKRYFLTRNENETKELENIKDVRKAVNTFKNEFGLDNVVIDIIHTTTEVFKEQADILFNILTKDDLERGL